MSHLSIRTFALYSSLLIFISCQSAPNKKDEQNPGDTDVTVIGTYRGNMSSVEYDSIVNQLTLYNNETCVLHQVDRIAEHHLNEREHQGIYAYLADSTQLALYSNDGVIMLRFELLDQGITPMSINGDRILDSSNIWKPK